MIFLKTTITTIIYSKEDKTFLCNIEISSLFTGLTYKNQLAESLEKKCSQEDFLKFFWSKSPANFKNEKRKFDSHCIPIHYRTYQCYCALEKPKTVEDVHTYNCSPNMKIKIILFPLQAQISLCS